MRSGATHADNAPDGEEGWKPRAKWPRDKLVTKQPNIMLNFTVELVTQV